MAGATTAPPAAHGSADPAPVATGGEAANGYLADGFTERVAFGTQPIRPTSVASAVLDG